MPHSPRHALLIIAALTLAGSVSLRAQQAPEEPTGAAAPNPFTHREEVDVELVIMPFYAIDKDGDPVFDLSREEIELTIDGEPVALDFFDAYGELPAPERVGSPSSGGAPAEMEPRAESEPATIASPARESESLGTPPRPGRTRHVFLLFDEMFTQPRAVPMVQRVAHDLVAELPTSDWLYVVKNHSQEGFRQTLGPVAADQRGRQAVAAEVAALRPNIQRGLRVHADIQDKINHGQKFRSDNVVDAYWDAHQSRQAEYGAAATGLATSLESFSAFLQQIQGPKLVLFFSNGIHSRLYTEGTPRFPAIRNAFEPSLRAIGRSGAMLLFVNTLANVQSGLDENTFFVEDADPTFVNSLAVGETALEMMAQESGGRVVSHTNPERLANNLIRRTSAYYEVGFYPHPSVAGLSSKAVPQVVIHRPGVEVWSPRWLKTRRPFSELLPRERKFLIAELVLEGAADHQAGSLSSAYVFPLEGSYSGMPAAAERQLRFEARWPQTTMAREVELWEVVAKTSPDLGTMELVRVTKKRHGVVSETSTFETKVPDDGTYLWGIVAAEPASNVLYLRRMMVHPSPKPVASSDTVATNG